MKTGHVQIHLISPLGIPPNEALACLTDMEKLRAMRFRFPKDAAHWSACRAALRRILGELLNVSPTQVPLIYNEFGKPMLAAPFDQLHFNLSHSTDLALLAVCGDGPVGVDLESESRASELLGCEETFCHRAEIRALPAFPQEQRALSLLRLWTAKEALVKALGTGFSNPLEAIMIQLGPRKSAATSTLQFEGISDQSIRQLEHAALDGYCAHLAAPPSVNRIDIVAAHQMWKTAVSH